MGRRRRNNQPVITRVSPAMKSWLVTQATERECTLSDVLRAALVAGIEQMTTGPGQGREADHGES